MSHFAPVTLCITKCINILIRFLVHINAIFAKVIIRSIAYLRWLRNVKRLVGLSGPLLTDLSKALDCIKHDLLISKLAANEFDFHSLSFIFSYLTKRKQGTKIQNSYIPYAGHVKLSGVIVRPSSFQHVYLLHAF